MSILQRPSLATLCCFLTLPKNHMEIYLSKIKASLKELVLFSLHKIFYRTLFFYDRFVKNTNLLSVSLLIKYFHLIPSLFKTIYSLKLIQFTFNPLIQKIHFLLCMKPMLTIFHNSKSCIIILCKITYCFY